MREATRIGGGAVQGGGAERNKITELRGETRSLGGVARKSVYFRRSSLAWPGSLTILTHNVNLTKDT
jgi:hypothetical protein